MASRAFLVVDANVLLDYMAADLAILSLVSRHIGKVHIVKPVLSEVDGLDESDCERLGFYVVEPTLTQASEAAIPDTRLSFEDRTCLIVCRDEGWTCISNDKALRRACGTIGVAVRWGLELMLELVQVGHLSADDAMLAAADIHRANPLFLGPKVLADFRKKLDTRAGYDPPKRE